MLTDRQQLVCSTIDLNRRININKPQAKRDLCRKHCNGNLELTFTHIFGT